MTTGAESRDNETLFNEWYERNDERIRALCFDYLPDLPADEDAEDLAQEVYTRIWENVESFKGESNFNTWANKVAINALNDRLDYENADKRTAETEEYEDEYCDPYPQPSPAIYDKFNLLLKYTERLEGINKNVMEMYCDGYTHMEIARFLNLTKGQVNHAIRHSKQLLRKMAADDEDWDYGGGVRCQTGS